MQRTVTIRRLEGGTSLYNPDHAIRRLCVWVAPLSRTAAIDWEWAAPVDYWQLQFIGYTVPTSRGVPTDPIANRLLEGALPLLERICSGVLSDDVDQASDELRAWLNVTAMRWGSTDVIREATVATWMEGRATPDVTGKGDEEIEDLAEAIDSAARAAGYEITDEPLDWLLALRASSA